jgi:hypothetical protein
MGKDIGRAFSGKNWEGLQSFFSSSAIAEL